MIRQTYEIEIITPCFLGGADAAKAEIRSPSIRGQLRWWFRILGGSAAEESLIFGSAAGEDGVASSLRTATSNFTPGPRWAPPIINQNSPENYVWHFAAASGKPTNAGANINGPRWQTQGAIPPGSTFTLAITFRRPLPSPLMEKIQFSLDAFLCFGSLGLRATRGLGAFHCPQAKPWHDLLEPVSHAGFTIALRKQPETFATWETALKDWSAWLRYKFRKENKAARFSALGGIQPRQASAVRFRPIRLAPTQYTWIAMESPHRVLGQKTTKLLTSEMLIGPAPTAPPRSRY